MRNIGLASIEDVRPQLGQNSNVPHKTSLHAKFQVISSIGGRFIAPPYPRIRTLLPPFKSKKHIWALHKKYKYVNLSTKLQSYICERKGITLYFHVQSYILFKLCL